MPTQLQVPAIKIVAGVTLVGQLREFFSLGARFRTGDARVGEHAKFQDDLTGSLAAVDGVLRAFDIPPVFHNVAKLAVVAFVDEAILVSTDRALWAGHTLEERLWRQRVAGEAFFVHLDRLEKEPDSLPLCNLLEVYCLCLMLGFKGKYTGSPGKEISEIVDRLRLRTQRFRNPDAALAPEGALPTEPPLREPVSTLR